MRGDRSQHGWEFLEQTIAPWRVFDPARADAIAAIENRASDTSDESTRFTGDQVAARVRSWTVSTTPSSRRPRRSRSARRTEGLVTA
jgi:hypothetical protein